MATRAFSRYSPIHRFLTASTAYFPSGQAFQRVVSSDVSEITSLTIKNRFRPHSLAPPKQGLLFVGSMAQGLCYGDGPQMLIHVDCLTTDTFSELL